MPFSLPNKPYFMNEHNKTIKTISILMLTQRLRIADIYCKIANYELL
jgi:hypothetical protein